MDALSSLFPILLVAGLVAAIVMAYHYWLEARNSGNEPPEPSPAPSRSPRHATGRARGHRCIYRTRDGADYFRFSIEPLATGAWRPYIVEQPSYGGRDEGAHATHRLSDGGRKYVCWTSTLPTLEQAQRVAAMWAEATQEYIRTGKRF